MVLVAAALLTAAAIAAPYVSRWIAKKTLDEETEKLLEKKEVKQTIRQAEEKMRQQSKGINLWGDEAKELTTYDIPGSQFYYRKKTSKIIEEELKRQGYSKKDIERITKGYERMELGEGIGEAAGTLTLSAASEKIGSAVAKPLIKSAGKSAAKRVAASMVGSAVGGAYEGAMQVQVSSLAKEGKWADIKTTAAGAAFGAGTAAIGGGVLAGLHELKVAKPNIATKGLYTFADWGGQSIIDPYEKPGDILAGMIGKSATKGGVSVMTPTIAVSAFSPTPSTSPTSTRSTSATPSISTTPSTSTSPTPSPAPTPTPTPAPTTTPTLTPVPSPSDTPSITPEPVPGHTPDTAVPTSSETPSDTPSDTPTPVPTMTSTPTPIQRTPFLPPLPMVPSQIGGAPTTYARRGNLRYYNELEYSKQVLRKLLW